MSKKRPSKNEPEKENTAESVITTNREAGRDYFIIESIEAGIMLVGCEVKSLREGGANLSGAFARFDKEELYLYSLHISPYTMGNRENPDPLRVRKLLLHRNQLEKLRARVQEKGLTLVPLKMYFTRGIAKIHLGLCRGKVHGDRRQDVKKKDIHREIDRAMKSRNRK